MKKSEFIKRAEDKHGRKYNYSFLPEEIKLGEKGVFVCPVHGQFVQKFSNHLNGAGCRKCGFKKIGINKTLDTESFILKAKKKHGEKYDYSLVKYVDFKTPVEIICQHHGVFLQRPDKHIQGCGCQICGRLSVSEKKTLNTEQFVSRAEQIHGERYDYSLVDYRNSKINVEIICPIHGKFVQTPCNHLSGKGCPVCSGSPNKSSDFIDECRRRFGDKFNYSEIKYKNQKTKIFVTCLKHGRLEVLPNDFLKDGCPLCKNEWNRRKLILKLNRIHKDRYAYSSIPLTQNDDIDIICPDHGKFKQRLSNHLAGIGCPKCGILKRSLLSKKSTEEFVQDARQKHGYKYDYSLVEYNTQKDKIEIICPKHGSFFQIPANHLQGAGCPKCGKENMAKIKVQEKANTFVSRAKKIHGEEFDYSLVEYVHARTPVKILCKKHGVFLQTPNKHLMGQKCPRCKESSGERLVSSLFKEGGLNFTTQKKFKWLGNQSLDFYIPDLHLAIEVQGIQHFEPTDFNGKGGFESEVNFIKATQNDLKKYSLCQENGIDILYFTDTGKEMMYGKTFSDVLALLTYLKKLSSFSKPRQQEAHLRYYSKA